MLDGSIIRTLMFLSPKLHLKVTVNYSTLKEPSFFFLIKTFLQCKYIKIRAIWGDMSKKRAIIYQDRACMSPLTSSE